MAPMTRPSGSRSAEAFSVVGITSPLARARVEPGVAGHALLDHLAQGRGELPRLLRADEPRQRLLDELVGAEAEQLGDGVVGLEDLALQVGDEHRVGGVLDQALGVGPRLVELAHVAEDADGADDPALRVPQRRGVERRRDDLAAGRARVERALRVTPFSTTSRRAAVNSRVSSGLMNRDSDCSIELVGAEAEQLGDGVVGLEDLALEVGDEHRVGGVLDQALGVGPRLVQLAHVAEDADGADHPALRVPQRRGVQRRRDDLARGAARG